MQLLQELLQSIRLSIFEKTNEKKRIKIVMTIKLMFHAMKALKK